MSDFDYTNIVRSVASASARKASLDIDANPDDGARALQLAQVTGAQPDVVYGNLDNFERQTKSSLTSQIVQNNTQISDYIRGNKLASVVSNDDYANLDKFSGSATKTSAFRRILAAPQTAIGGALSGAWEGAKSGAQTITQDQMNQAWWGPVVGSAINLGGAAFGALSGGITGGVQAGTEAVTGDKDIAASATREAGGMMEAFMGHASGAHSEIRPEAATSARAIEGLNVAKAWTDAGVEAPVGVHPYIDEIKAKTNEAGVKQLQEDLANAQSSLTKERSPELFGEFAKQHYGDQTIGLSGDKVAELYGDKIPEPDDGKLGWVPGIEDKLAIARATGEDVHVPIADWITKVDPALAKEFQDDIRMWPGGITTNEAKPEEGAEPTPEQPIVQSSVLAQIRDVAGLEPLPVTQELVKAQDVAKPFTDAQMDGATQGLTLKLNNEKLDPNTTRPTHNMFDVMDANGNKIAELDMEKIGTNLSMRNITGPDGKKVVNELGPTMVRQILQAIQDKYPDVETITGQRISGARKKAGVVGTRADQVKFQLPQALEQLNQIKAQAAGVDAATFKRISKLIDDRHTEDLAEATKLVEREQTKRQSLEWKSNREAIRPEVEASVRTQPAVAADMFVGGGEVAGQKVRQRFPLAEDDLSAEQKASLPDHYYAKSGAPVDEIARMFGFGSGDAMVKSLAEYQATKEGRTPAEHFNKLVNDATDAAMEAKYGSLAENILQEATDQAYSETGLNLVIEEYQAEAMKQGKTGIDKATAQAAAKADFGKMTVGDVNTQRLMSMAGKNYQDAVKALAAGDPATAVVALERRMFNSLLAAESLKLDKEMKTFDRVAKQFSAREVKSVDPEYTNFVHQILTQVGKPVRRSIQDIAEQIGAGEAKSLADFVAVKEAALRELPVWDQLYDTSWRKAVPELAVDEFRAVNDSIKALVHNGRDEMKIVRAGEAEDLDVVKGKMIEGLEQFDKLDRLMKPGVVMQKARSYLSSNIQIENTLNRWDKFDPKGPWNQYFMRDLIDGANQEDAWRKEYAGKLLKLDDGVNMKRTVDNTIFRNPDNGSLIPFNHENLRTVMLNVSSNMKEFAGGYKLSPQQVMDWVHEHATKEDWNFVQGVWDNIFKDIKGKSDTMYRSLTGGVAVKNVPIAPIETAFGTYEGGYYPIIHHSEFEGSSKKLMGKDALEQQNYVRATTLAGYTKERTGYIAPISLDLDQMPNRIAQSLHDIALRPAVLNASKIVFDKDVRREIRSRYGKEYQDGLTDYLKGVANSSNDMSSSQSAMRGVSEFVRQNLITTLVGLNPGTVMKHGPSAMVSSMREVGAIEYLKATKSLFSINDATGDSNWNFAKSNSLELQRRERNWQESLYGATNELSVGSRLSSVRQSIIEAASKPVALSDMISAVPTWLAAYNKEMAETGIHGDAIYMGDRAVRRAHGSTAVTNRTAFQRDRSPWLTSVYNYFSDIMNRQMETLWKAGDAAGLAKEGQYGAAMKAVPALTASLFAYAIWPAIVEQFVSPLESKPDDSWAKKSAKGIAFTLGASWPVVRDFSAYMLGGFDPQLGLGGTAMKEIADIWKDVGKNQPMSRANVGKTLQDGAAFLGTMTGMMPLEMGHLARFAVDVNSGVARPRGPWQWAVGARYGTLKGHSATFEQYMKGQHQ